MNLLIESKTRTLRLFDIPKGASGNFEQPDLPDFSGWT